MSAADAALLREWGLHLLGTRDGPPDACWEEAASCGLAGWHLFLQMEGCALALRSRLDGHGARDRLPGAVTALLRRRALAELQRVLSARAQIETVAELAAAHGWTIIVLKGGAAVAAGEQIDLGDVDILVDSERVHDVAAALDAIGYGRHGDDGSIQHHLAPRHLPNALSIEVHRSVKDGTELNAYLAAALPLSDGSPLWRQGPVDHLSYLLRHIALQHPERIGRIRDLLLIAHAVRACTPEQLAEVERALSSSAHGDVMAEILRTAGELDAQRYSDDPFRRLVVRSYCIVHRFERLAASPSGAYLLLRSIRILARNWREWWSAFASIHRVPVTIASPLRAVAWMERHTPHFGRAVRQLQRHATFGVVTLIAIFGEVAARRIEARRPRLHGAGHTTSPDPRRRVSAATPPQLRGGARQ